MLIDEGIYIMLHSGKTRLFRVQDCPRNGEKAYVQYLKALIERDEIGRTSCKRKVVSKQQAHDLPQSALLLIIKEVIIDDYPLQWLEYNVKVRWSSF